MKVFISYHLADSKYVEKIKTKLVAKSISFYAVPEQIDFSGWHNEEISKYLLTKMSDCDVCLCIIGNETYTRPHVDYEIHNALKGGVTKRLGIVAVLIESRGDNVNDLDFRTFPPRLSDNKDYVVLVQNASLIEKIEDCLKMASYNRKTPTLTIDNSRRCMKLPNTYYE